MGGPKKSSDIEQIIAQGRYKEAIKQLEKLLEEDNRNPKLRFMLTQCYFAIKANQQTVMHAKKILKMGKFTQGVSEIKVRELIAKSLYEMENLTDAKNEYLILSSLEPNNFINFYKAGKIFFTSNVPVKALKFLQKAIQINPKHSQSLSLAGQCHYQARNYSEAKLLLTKALEIKPDLYDAHYYLGLALRYMGDHEWAIKEFDIAQKDEVLKVKAMLAKGMALIDQESYARAITEFDRGLRHATPKSDISIQLQYLMSIANEKSRDIPAAIQLWETLEGIKPGYRDVKDKLKQYREFRTDDKIKDFLICGTAQFEGISRKVIESFGYTVGELKIIDDVIIFALGIEKEAAQRNAKRNHCYFQIQREMTPIKDETIRSFHEKMREKNANRGYILTTSEFTPTAIEFAASRPIELIDSGSMADIIKKALNSNG